MQRPYRIILAEAISGGVAKLLPIVAADNSTGSISEVKFLIIKRKNIMSSVLISSVLGLLVMPLTISSVLANSNYNNVSENISQTIQVQRPERNQNRIFEQLNLTEEQTEKIIAIREQNQQEIRQSLQDLRNAQSELNKMITGTDTDNQLRQKHDKVLQLRKELAELQFNTILKIREVLNPEQLQQWSKLMEQRRESLKNR